MVWRKAQELTLQAYQATARFPREEAYSLTSQIRRSASSIPSNIAEGCGRGSNNDLARFLHIALGSACEVDYELQLAHELGYVNEGAYATLEREVDEVKKMLSSLIRRIARTNGVTA